VKVLAIEISSSRGSIAIAEGGCVIAAKHFACDRGRGTEVFAALRELRGEWKDVGTVAVGIGPGSYNGLRTACAIATSLNMAVGTPLRAIPSPCLLPVKETHYRICGDARGGRAYCAEVRDRRLIGEILLIPHAEIAALAAGALPMFRTGALPEAGHLPEATPDAGVLALLAPDFSAVENGRIEPIYLKPPHITMPRGQAT